LAVETVASEGVGSVEKTHLRGGSSRTMYTDPPDIEFTKDFGDLDENCLETALLDEKPLEDCFGSGGLPLCYWKDDINLKCCNELLVIDADYLMTGFISKHWPKEDLIKAIRSMVRDCPHLRHIRIGGSYDAMGTYFKLVTPTGGRKGDFAAFIAGINVLKAHGGPPLVVSTMTKLGSGPSSRVVKFRYV